MSTPIPLAGQQPELLSEINRLFGPERTKNFTPDQLFRAAEIAQGGGEWKGLVPVLKENREAQKELMKEIAEIKLQEGIQRQKFGKESLALTSLYDQIGRLPGTIASAFGGAGERQMMSDLYGQIPQIVSETYRTFPQRQIQPVSVSMPSVRYF